MNDTEVAAASWSERELAQRIEADDTGAWEELVRRERHFLWSWFASRIDNTDTADDLTQEVLLDAYMGRHRLRNGTAIGPWVMGIAKHKLFSHWRRSRRSNEIFVEKDVSVIANYGECDDTLEMVPEREALRSCVYGLSPVLHEALALHWQGHRIKEQAAVSGVNIEVAQKRLSRAREALRICMAAMPATPDQ